MERHPGRTIGGWRLAKGGLRESGVPGLARGIISQRPAQQLPHPGGRRPAPHTAASAVPIPRPFSAVPACSVRATELTGPHSNRRRRSAPNQVPSACDRRPLPLPVPACPGSRRRALHCGSSFLSRSPAILAAALGWGLSRT